ncbi:T9SS type A sorting domain-containing protein [Spirosoma aerolatum]|uniref:T9SS type A sorting domain-containing protein n=1 Tax=Spirosoma aerolatum TaxID=1211326 RepID=UPI001FECA981|nr:T9SS type A sorting domain-containing protein [Spirosoma aerolatum]
MERSKDLKSFETLTLINEVAGTLQASSHYATIDNNPYPGTSYYRLAQIDLSGQVTLFPAVAVVLREKPYQLWPNPLANGQAFSLSLDEPQTALVKLYAPNGQPVALHKLGVESASLRLQPATPLPAGVYLLSVEERALIRYHRLVIP